MNLLRSLMRSPLTGPLAFRPGPDTSWPFANIGGRTYPIQTLLGERQSISDGFGGYVAGMFQANPTVFACEMARINLFKQARFMWRRMNSGRPGDLYGNPDLRILERPWPKAVTSDLLSVMLLYADFGGSCFVVRRSDAIRPLRPDWVTPIFGSRLTPGPAAWWDVDAKLIAIAYQPGGAPGGEEPQIYLAEEVALFVTTPDPLRPGGLGQPWVRSIVGDVMADSAATAHKLNFFVNGATPNMIVTVDKAYNDDQIKALRKQIDERHTGVANAYRTLILKALVEKVDVVGKDLQQLDFKAVQGAGETRVCVAAQVPAVVAGVSEGLQGSSLNSGNYAASMRRFADLWARPAWQNVAGSLEAIVPPPDSSSNLWYDDRDVPALKDDVRDAAEVQGLNATAVRTLVDGGFDPDSVIKAITSGDLRLLKGNHTGLLPVQLQKPGGEPKPEPGPIPEQLLPFVKPNSPSGNGKSTAAETLAPLMKKGAD